MSGRTRPVPLYSLSKHVLLSLAVSFPVLSCGDGGFDPSEPINVTVVSGDGQSVDVGETLPQALVVRSSDLDGNTLGNVDLVFSVVQGGGSLGTTAVTTNAQGMASTTWTMGTQEGPQQVVVSAGTNPGADATFSASATDFRIEVVFINHGTPSQDAVFLAAADRWMSILQGELINVDFSSNPVPANQCVQGQPAVSETIDDLRIYVDIIPIDGPFATLGQAGPCQIRNVSQLPVLGYMQFDSADLDRIEQGGDLVPVTLHEMGHVLGIGTLWDNFDTLLVNPSLPSNSGVDTHFSGKAAIAAFNAAGGASYTEGAKVPVENRATIGSSDSHWRESVLELELMTPELSSGVANPLSAITTESLVDLGYSVDSSGVDLFIGTFSAPARLKAPGGRVIKLENDTYRGPLQMVDSFGNVAKTILGR
jgi:hypothetical protein